MYFVYLFINVQDKKKIYCKKLILKYILQRNYPKLVEHEAVKQALVVPQGT